MKRLNLIGIISASALLTFLTGFCLFGGAEGPIGPQGEQGIQGETGNGILSIDLTTTEGLVDVYTITYTDGNTTTFKVINGKEGTQGQQGIQGIQGEPGEDGHSPVITIQEGYWYVDGVNTEIAAIGIKGETGNGISAIELTSKDGLVDTYTITYTDGNTTTFTVTNGKEGPQGEQGIQGIQGEPGKDGHSPVITIQDGYWYIDGVSTGVVANGLTGAVGNGISSIKLTSKDGLVDTYTITYTDGNTTTFTVTNGKDGEQGIQGEPGKDGHTPVITIGINGNWFIDGVDTNVKAQGLQGETGNGISSIKLTSSEGLVDKYTITYTDGNTTTFKVTNGKEGPQGEQGIQGIQGEPGKDGHSPVITIQDGFWYIDGVSTGVVANGLTGDIGNGISSIKLTSSEGLVDTYTITYTDGNTTTFTVTNGKDGEQGIQGEPGKDGHTPVITIGINGNWFIDGVDTNVKAQGLPGEKGETGPQGPQGIPGKDGSKWYYGTGIPNIDANEGDYYIDTDNNDFYVYEGGDWELIHNLNGKKEYVTIELIFEGGLLPEGYSSTIKVEKGNCIDLPVPTMENHIFTGWYTGDNYDDILITNYHTISRNMTLYASWENTVFEFDLMDGNVKLTKYIGNKNITSLNIGQYIYDETHKYKVTEISKGILAECTNLENISIPFIGDKEFDSTASFGYLFGAASYSDNKNSVPQSLKEVTILSGDSICDQAFYGCQNLENIYIPETITYIGNTAFYQCTNLTKLILPSSLISVGSNAFSLCTNLEEVYYDGTLSNWSNIQFSSQASNPKYYCDNIYFLNDNGKYEEFTKIILDNSVTRIGNYQFYGFDKITEVFIPDSVESIGVDAFRNCPNIQKITLPFIGESQNATASKGVFGYIFGYTTQHDYNDDWGYSANYSFIDKKFGTKPDDAVWQYSSRTYNSGQFYYVESYYYYIPSSLTEVVITKEKDLSNVAFLNCTNITKITLPLDLKNIQTDAFNNCNSLEDVYYQGNESDWCSIKLATTKSNPMYYAKNFYILNDDSQWEKLTEIVLNESVTSIGEHQFYNFDSITKVVVPNNVERIEKGAFRNCSNIQSMTLPYVGKSMDAADYEAVFGYIFGYNVYKGSAYSTGSSSTAFVNMHNVASKSGETWQYTCGNYKADSSSSSTSYYYGEYNYFIPESVTEVIITDQEVIPIAAFNNCSNLISIILNDNLKTINKNAFSKCVELKNITIPNSVTTINGPILNGCKNLESITVPFIGDSVKSSTDAYQYPLGYLFGNSIYDGGVETIQSYYGNNTFTSVIYYIPQSLKEVIVTGGNINYGAFQNCTNLETVIIADDSTYIGAYAFYKCANLTDFVIPEMVIEIGEYAFYGCEKLVNMEIPERISVIGINSLLFEGNPFDVVLLTSYDRYAWTNSNGVYTSSNQGKSNSTSSMVVEINHNGQFSFDYMSYGEQNYDYLIVMKNGILLFDSKSTSTSKYYSYTLSVQKGDIIRFYFKKDQATDSGQDCAKVKNITFVAE